MKGLAYTTLAAYTALTALVIFVAFMCRDADAKGYRDCYSLEGMKDRVECLTRNDLVDVVSRLTMLRMKATMDPEKFAAEFEDPNSEPYKEMLAIHKKLSTLEFKIAAYCYGSEMPTEPKAQAEARECYNNALNLLKDLNLEY